MKNLVFITGLRKSGTSMAKSLFDGHPSFFTFPAVEFELFHYTEHDSFIANKYMRSSNFENIKEKFANNSFIKRLNSSQHERDLRSSINVSDFQERCNKAEAASYKEIIELFFREMAASSDRFADDIDQKVGVCKCVMNEEYLPELLEWYPDAKMIYVLRNPYGHFNAIRQSLRTEKGGYEGQRLSNFKHAYPAVGAQIRTMRLSYLFMEKWERLYPNNFHVQVYDRLLESPRAELEKLMEFVGEPFDERLLIPTVDGEIFKGNSWYVDEFDGIDKRPLEHWKKEISPLEIRLINEYFGDVFERYGFEILPSKASLFSLNHISERPINFLLNRLVLKAPSWFGGVRSYGNDDL